LGLAINTIHVAAEHRRISTVIETHTRSSTNAGNWTGCFIMPSTWQVVNNAAVIDAPNLIVPDEAQYWQKTIPLGHLAMLLAGGNGNGPIQIYTDGPTDPAIHTTGGYTGYWYNNMGSQIIPNLTSGAITPQWYVSYWAPESHASDEGSTLIPAHWEFGSAWALYSPFYLEFSKV
jgi:hypothetical protein